MTIAQLIAQLRASMAAKVEQRNTHAKELETLRSNDVVDEAKVAELRAAKDAIDSELDVLQARVADLEAEQARDDAANRLTETLTPVAARAGYDQVARTGQEPRTYAPASDPKGTGFLADVGRNFLHGDPEARERLARHMQEERVERAGQQIRAAGTGNFAGLTVPQYLTELYAPFARAARPFADACRSHDLPPDGMTVNLSRITTGSTAALQTSENTAVSETNVDDTLLTLNVLTNAGQQTISRQALERSTGVDSAVMEDLFKAYNTALDSTLLNQATTGLSGTATSIAYTDATPTAAELYPKLLEAISGVEGALLDQQMGDTIAVMHSRRWYWLQSQVGTSRPFVQQPGIDPESGAINYAERYGRGFRGWLPNGTPVIVDNNVATNFGAGTNEDEIYFTSRDESHLWEDPSAPMLIRAEQTSASSLGVLFVVYGYFAYTHSRYAQARKIAGTGLVTPAFTGA